MSNSVFQGAVAIDTNVFEHIFNKEKNVDSHIDDLLLSLQEDSIRLLVDEGSKIFDEYERIIGPKLAYSEHNYEISVLRYWLGTQETWEPVDVVSPSELMAAIKRIVHEPDENVDRILVYVALYRGKNLISNDEVHIVIGPQREWGDFERRHRLKKQTRNICKASRQSEILTSVEAHAEVVRATSS